MESEVPGCQSQQETTPESGAIFTAQYRSLETSHAGTRSRAQDAQSPAPRPRTRVGGHEAKPSRAHQHCWNGYGCLSSGASLPYVCRWTCDIVCIPGVIHGHQFTWCQPGDSPHDVEVCAPRGDAVMVHRSSMAMALGLLPTDTAQSPSGRLGLDCRSHGATWPGEMFGDFRSSSPRAPRLRSPVDPRGCGTVGAVAGHDLHGRGRLPAVRRDDRKNGGAATNCCGSGLGFTRWDREVLSTSSRDLLRL